MSAVCLFAVLFYCSLLFCQRQSFHLFTVLLVSVALSFHCLVLSLIFFTVLLAVLFGHLMIYLFTVLSVSVLHLFTVLSVCQFYIFIWLFCRLIFLLCCQHQSFTSSLYLVSVSFIFSFCCFVVSSCCCVISVIFFIFIRCVFSVSCIFLPLSCCVLILLSGRCHFLIYLTYPVSSICLFFSLCSFIIYYILLLCLCYFFFSLLLDFGGILCTFVLTLSVSVLSFDFFSVQVTIFHFSLTFTYKKRLKNNNLRVKLWTLFCCFRPNLPCWWTHTSQSSSLFMRTVGLIRSWSVHFLPHMFILLCLVCCALLGSQCCCCIDGVYGVSTLMGVVSEVVYFLFVFR